MVFVATALLIFQHYLFNSFAKTVRVAHYCEPFNFYETILRYMVIFLPSGGGLYFNDDVGKKFQE